MKAVTIRKPEKLKERPIAILLVLFSIVLKENLKTITYQAVIR